MAIDFGMLALCLCGASTFYIIHRHHPNYGDEDKSVLLLFIYILFCVRLHEQNSGSHTIMYCLCVCWSLAYFFITTERQQCNKVPAVSLRIEFTKRASDVYLASMPLLVYCLALFCHYRNPIALDGKVIIATVYL